MTISSQKKGCQDACGFKETELKVETSVLALRFTNGVMTAQALQRFAPRFLGPPERPLYNYTLMKPLVSFVTAQAAVRGWHLITSRGAGRPT